MNVIKIESTIIFSGSSQGESSVLRVRLMGRNKTHYEYSLAHCEYTLVEVNMH